MRFTLSSVIVLASIFYSLAAPSDGTSLETSRIEAELGKFLTEANRKVAAFAEQFKNGINLRSKNFVKEFVKSKTEVAEGLKVLGKDGVSLSAKLNADIDQEIDGLREFFTALTSKPEVANFADRVKDNYYDTIIKAGTAIVQVAAATDRNATILWDAQKVIIYAVFENSMQQIKSILEKEAKRVVAIRGTLSEDFHDSLSAIDGDIAAVCNLSDPNDYPCIADFVSISKFSYYF